LMALCSPYSWPIARSVDSTTECRTPFRRILHFNVIAVMSVISGTFPDTYGVFYMTINSWRVRDRHVIVMVSVTEETPYLSGLLATVTVMTLMTLIYGLILEHRCHWPTAAKNPPSSSTGARCTTLTQPVIPFLSTTVAGENQAGPAVALDGGSAERGAHRLGTRPAVGALFLGGAVSELRTALGRIVRYFDHMTRMRCLPVGGEAGGAGG
jgi:hypothetical protein